MARRTSPYHLPLWREVRLPLPVVLALSLLPLQAPAVRAQIEVIEGPLPVQVEEDVLDFLNSPDVLRLPGGSRVPTEASIQGDVAVLGGSLELGGEITGRLVVVNGDLVLLPESRVGGGVVVIGGLASGANEAELDGGATAYAAPLRYRVQDGQVRPLPSEDLSPGLLATDLGFGQVRFGLRAGTGYNRVEGLPVRFGPILRTGGSNPLTLEAFAIWRSVSGLNLETERLGHYFRLTQAVGGRGIATVGATAHDEVATIEDQGLSDLEASLATFLLRDDFRDYYERDGWSAFATLRPSRIPLQASITYRDEDHATPPIRDPWTLRSDDDPWRPLPLVAEGRIQSVEGSLRWDSRNDPTVPSDGWWLEANLRRQIGGSLGLRASAPPADGEVHPPLSPGDRLPRVTRGLIDLRRYARVGPSSRLSLRGVLAGSLDGSALPPQYQLALGGEGSLPGHRRFSVDCGARDGIRFARTGEGEEEAGLEPVHPAYGCDRMFLFQAEFQSALPVSWNPLPEDWRSSELSPLFDLQPIWSVFLDAGRGWALGDLGTDLTRHDTETHADIGVGLFVGSLGVYWSYPLNQQDRGVNFFVRLQRRF